MFIFSFAFLALLARLCREKKRLWRESLSFRVVSVFASCSPPAVSRLIPWNKQHMQAGQPTAAAAAKTHPVTPHAKSCVTSQIFLIMLTQLVSTLNPLLTHIDKACLEVLSIVSVYHRRVRGIVIWLLDPVLPYEVQTFLHSKVGHSRRGQS